MATEAAKAVDPPDLTKSPEQAGASPAALETTAAGIAVLAACAAPGRSRTRGALPGHCGAACCDGTSPPQHERTRPTSRGRRAPAREDADPTRDDPPVTDMVMRARNGDKRAWDALVERYAPLVWSICRRYRLDAADAEDVSQVVWLHLLDQLDSLRDPAALPGWLATTARRECCRVLRTARGPQSAMLVLDADNIADTQTATTEQELLKAERNAALLDALTDLPPSCQQLIALLTADPPVSYAQISAKLGISVGSIGPTRSRCLDRLRRHPAIAALISA
jgi:RNA polymerase sigma factor (sigma-70 family)